MVFKRHSLVVGFLSFVFMLQMGCGMHEQSVFRKDKDDPTITAGETDPKILMENAVSEGNLDKIRELLEQGISVDLIVPSGLSLMMVAIDSQQYAALELLVELGADLEVLSEPQPGNANPTPLDVFAYLDASPLSDGIKTVVSKILKKEPIDAVFLEEKGYLFDGGITFKSHFFAQWLLDKGVSPNSLKDGKNSPLTFLFTQKGVVNRFKVCEAGDLAKELCETEGGIFKSNDDLDRLKNVFDVLVNAAGVDFNLVVSSRKRTALGRARSSLRSVCRTVKKAQSSAAGLPNDSNEALVFRAELERL
ncbi:MAG: hypothetical protein AAF203_09055, partial [Pseudomonadota bacterium]